MTTARWLTPGVAYQRLELGEVLVEFAQAGNVQSVEKVAGLEIPPLAVVGARPGRHLPIGRDPGAARLQIAAQVGEVNAPGIQPQAVLPLPVVGRSAQFQTSQVAVERKWIDAEPSAICLPVRVGGDVGRAVERLANDRHRQVGVIARPVGCPYRVVGVLPKLAPLIRRRAVASRYRSAAPGPRTHRAAAL